MTLFTRIIAGLRGLFRPRQQEQELDEELRAYLDTAIEQKVRAGLTREAAMREARLQMGSLDAVKDHVRDVWWESLVFSCWQDVRYALRTLRKTPAFTTVAILTLALGIGANTAIFTVVDSLLLRALPVAEPQRLVTLGEGGSADQGPAPWTYAIWEQVRQRWSLFDGALAWAPWGFNLAQGGETQPVAGIYVNGDFFTTLGVPPLLGRTFTAADDRRGGGMNGPVAIISYGLWRRRFGGAANVIGSPIVVERVPCTIVGVTPPDFFGAEVGRAFDLALPFGVEPLLHGKDPWIDGRRTYWLTIMLRLKPAQSIEAATAVLRGVQPQIREGALPWSGPQPVHREFMEEALTLAPAAAGTSPLRQRYERPLLAILVVVALVLLIACANIANLLLARASARRHEVSLRFVLGASRWRLARQFLIESVVLSSLGAGLGLLFAVWGSRALVAQLSTPVNRVALDLSLDWRMIAFTAAVTIATTVLFGTAPVLHATRVAPIDALKEHGRSADRGFVSRAAAGGANGGRGYRPDVRHVGVWRSGISRVGAWRAGFSSGLVVAQISLSLVLVVAAGLFVRTFERMANVPLGFDSDRVLVVTVDATHAQANAAANAATANRPVFYQRLIDAARAVPGVAQASVSTVTPASGGGTRFPVDVPDGAKITGRERSVRANAIAPGWLATYGTPLRAGRDIEARDIATAPRVMLVNEAFVRRFFPGGSAASALGKTVNTPAPPGSQDTPAAKTIVGVVQDAIYRSLRDGIEPTVYEPIAQETPRGPGISLSVRASASTPGSPAALAPSVAAALTAVDRDLAFSFRPLADQVRASFAQERLVAMLSGFFGALALLLAGLGLYGVTTYAATRRRAEIGIRIALGATRTDVIALVLRRSLIVTTLGIALGLAAAAAVTRYLEVMLFGLTPLDPTTFIAVSVLFATVALLAAFVPARRATRIDPLVALRHE